MILGISPTGLHRGGDWPLAIQPSTCRVPSLHWYNAEIAPGVYDWKKFDATFEKIPAGVEVLLSFNGPPTHWSARPKEVSRLASKPAGSDAEPSESGFTALTDYITTALNRYPQIQFVEGWNEPNSNFTGDIDALVRVQRTQNSAVRAFNKATGRNVKMLSPKFDLSCLGLSWFTQLFQRTGAYDIVSIHSGGRTLDPMELESGLWQLRQLIARSPQAQNKPVWSVEGGWTSRNGVDFSTLPNFVQLSLLESTVATMRKYNVTRWYMWHDDPQMGFQGNAEVKMAWNKLQGG